MADNVCKYCGKPPWACDCHIPKKPYISAIQSVCCDTPVINAAMHVMNGRFLSCSHCLNVLAFVPQEDMETLAGGDIPPDDVFPWLKTMKDFMAAFRDMVTVNRDQWIQDVAAFKLYERMRLAAIDDAIVGEGTQMVDGVWKPRGVLDWIQESPQSED